MIHADRLYGGLAMRPWVDRVTFPALEYVGDTILNLLIVAGGLMLLMIGLFLFAL